MFRMMMAMGAASVMGAMVLTGTASLAVYGTQAVLNSTTERRKTEGYQDNDDKSRSDKDKC